MRRLWRKFDNYITKMSQETFDSIMIVVISVLLVIGGIFIFPKAFDTWFYEEYEKPVIELKKLADTQPIEQSIEYEYEIE